MTAETNAERLQSIKDWHQQGGISHQEIDWLIQQAELVGKVEAAAAFSHNLQAKLLRDFERQNKDMRHRILKVCNNVGAFPKATVKDYVLGVFKDYLPGRKAE